jgi:3-deoxy-D-manno-octulosonic-acid transferase
MFLYKTLITILYPFIRLYLGMRQRKGKEDAHPDRFAERLGRASLARPDGFLIWLHGASVGEINSMRGLIARLRRENPKVKILMTSGTVAAAKVAKNFDVLHQYAPVDVPFVVRRFLRHWRPNLAVRVDSDLWPIQLDALRTANVPSFLLNGALSRRSFGRHKKNKKFVRRMMQSFTKIIAKSPQDAERFIELGAKNVGVMDNLKYTSPPSADNPAERKKWQTAAGKRPVWHAAVLGESESEIVLAAHKKVLGEIPNALLLITPRHPSMKAELLQSAKAAKMKISFRSDGAAPAGNIYVADTIGEMGLFYRCANAAFMGRSLLPQCRGSSPIEAMQLGNVVITGRHTSTFDEVYDEMAAYGILERVDDSSGLADAITRLLTDKKFFARATALIKKFMEDKEDTLNIVMDELKKYIK